MVLASCIPFSTAAYASTRHPMTTEVARTGNGIQAADIEHTTINTDNGEGLHAVIPTPQQMEFTAGPAWVPRAAGHVIVTADASPRQQEDAQLFAQQLTKVTGYAYSVSTKTAQIGDVVFTLGAVPAVPQGKEADAYQLVSNEGIIRITAPTERGLFYGGQTVMQSVRSMGAVQAATVTDWSAYPVRSLHVDAARKYLDRKSVV